MTNTTANPAEILLFYSSCPNLSIYHFYRDAAHSLQVILRQAALKVLEISILF